MMAKERVHWVDVAKGILILLLLIHHFTTATERNGIDLSQYSFMTSWTILFTSFFMQAFFIMSGYCSNFEKPASVFFCGIFKQLIVPFICFEYYICVFNSKSFLFTNIYSYWIESGGTHLWFLNALIVSKVFIWCYIKCYKSETFLLLTSFLVFVGAVYLKQNGMGLNFMCLMPSLGSIFFVAFGYVCKNEYIFEKIRNLGIVFPYILLLLLLFHITIPAFMGGMKVSLKSLPIVVILSISGTMALINICMIIKERKVLEFFGRNTLVIYCLHFIPLRIILGIFNKLIAPISICDKLLLVFLVYTSEIIVLIVLIEMFKFKPFRWFIGKF